jgi:hypothetical protein
MGMSLKEEAEDDTVAAIRAGVELVKRPILQRGSHQSVQNGMKLPPRPKRLPCRGEEEERGLELSCMTISAGKGAGEQPVLKRSA